MKRKYLIGAALILFMILSGSYYLKNQLAPKRKGEVDAKSGMSDSRSPVIAVDNAPAPPVIYNTPIQIADKYPAKHSPRTRHKSHPSAAIDNTADILLPTDNSLQASNKQDVKMNVRISKEYYGVAPEVQSTTTKLAKRKNNKHRHPINLYSPTIKFGPEFGFNQNGLSNNNLASNMRIGGVHAGIMVNLRLGDHLALQPGLRYINKGNRTESTLDVSTHEKLTLHYIEIPANLVYKFGDVSNTRVMVGAGPYVSYLAGARDRFSNNILEGSDVLYPATPIYKTNNIAKLDYGLGGFVGCETPEGIFAKVGVEYGMKDNLKDPATGTYSNRNYSLLISFGYILGGYQK